MCAHLCTKTCNFCDSSCDKRCFGVIAISKSVSGTCCKCNDILESSAEFHSQNIRSCIHTEYRAHKNSLQVFCCFSFFRTDNTCCRNFLTNLFRMAWSGKYADICCRDFFADDLAQRHQGVFFHSLCNIYNDLSFFYKRCHLLCSTSRKRRRNCKDSHIRIIQTAFEICCDLYFFRNTYSRKLGGMLSFLVQHLHFCFQS